MGPSPAEATGPQQEAGLLERIGSNTWASLGVLLGLWIVLGFVLFLVFALATNSFTVGLLGGVLGGLAAAGAVGWKLGLLDRVDQARRRAPLWARLLFPLPLIGFLWLVFLVVVGSLVEDFVLMVLLTTLLAAGVTAGIVWFAGLWSDVPARIRASSLNARLGALLAAGMLGGVVAFLLGLMLLQEASLALALLLPGIIGGVAALAWPTGWARDAKQAVMELHVGVRVATFVVLFGLLTFYFALLIGPFLTEVVFAYAVSAAIALGLLVPASMWVRTWRDLWEDFTALGEDNRVLVMLPIFPLAAGLVFLIIVVLTSMFELAYLISIPAGILIFLLVGLPFGVTQDIPVVIRDQRLPARVGIFLATFLLLTLYVYFGVALLLQTVEISLLIGLAVAALATGALIYWLNLAGGLGEEFESYGAIGEAAILGLIFLGTLVLSFLLLALATGSFRLAFLVSLAVAAGANYLVAHTTELIEGMREAVAGLAWWGHLLLLGGVFLVSFLYGELALGVFYSNVAVALAFGAVVALVSVYLVSTDLRIGDQVMASADQRRNARVVLMTLSFLGGMLAGMYVAAAALQLAGGDLFGLPFFVGLLTGTGALLWVARTRGWGTTAVYRIRTAKDRAKVGAALGLWIALGVLTGFALQSLPVSGADIGLGDDPVLPLTVTLATGLVLWVWLPVVLFRVVNVERPPMQATLAMGEKPKLLASLVWGLLAFLAAAVLLLSVLNDPVLGFGAAIAIGYLVALAMGMLRARTKRQPGSGEE